MSTTAKKTVQAYNPKTKRYILIERGKITGSRKTKFTGIPLKKA